MVKKFTIMEEEAFCKACLSWILRRTTSMGANIYGCRLGLKPRVYRKELVCKWKKKKLEVE